MLKITDTVNPSEAQMYAIIKGTRNPLNSWGIMDSVVCYKQPSEGVNDISDLYIGDRDLNLLERLSAAGNDHGKFLRMIQIIANIEAPLYWWKEYDTYKVGTVANSCSTMHKIQAREFTREDFSLEHLTPQSLAVLDDTIYALNHYRYIFNASGGRDKDAWWQMIQLLPTSFNQMRTVELNYATLKLIYQARKGHKLDEWQTFREWIETLPLAFELITGAAV